MQGVSVAVAALLSIFGLVGRAGRCTAGRKNAREETRKEVSSQQSRTKVAVGSKHRSCGRSRQRARLGRRTYGTVGNGRKSAALWTHSKHSKYSQR